MLHDPPYASFVCKTTTILAGSPLCLPSLGKALQRGHEWRRGVGRGAERREGGRQGCTHATLPSFLCAIMVPVCSFTLLFIIKACTGMGEPSYPATFRVSNIRSRKQKFRAKKIPVILKKRKETKKKLMIRARRTSYRYRTTVVLLRTSGKHDQRRNSNRQRLLAFKKLPLGFFVRSYHTVTHALLYVLFIFFSRIFENK